MQVESFCAFTVNALKRGFGALNFLFFEINLLLRCFAAARLDVYINRIYKQRYMLEVWENEFQKFACRRGHYVVYYHYLLNSFAGKNNDCFSSS
jgi:hypothetical protein